MSVTYALDSLANLDLYNVVAERVEYRGRRAIRLIEAAHDGDTIAVLRDSDFGDGVIETEISGGLLPDAAVDMRGFVGIAFRVQPGGSAYECFYLRPTNGRANDQLRRNHATQYVSHPDWPWFRLRQETPGVYESYTDVVPGEWTPIKIAVSGTRAELYVNNAPQPCLIVNDLKQGQTRGRIALWIGRGTDAHFSAITVT